VLRQLTLKPVYRSDEDSILADFYVPSLSQSISYDRAVGYFSSSMLSYAAQGIAALIEKQGTMRLIVGGEITQEESDAILNGYDLRAISERVGASFCKTVEQVVEELSYARLQALSWMIAQGSLSVKVALKRQGMYHEKIGIFRDQEGDEIVFQGSANETVNALLPEYNFESINVFPSWQEEFRSHAEPYVAGFERLWANKSKGTVVLEFPEAARDKLIRIAKRISVPPSPHIELATWTSLIKTSSDEVVGGPATPIVLGGEPFAIKDHQREALQKWRAQDLQGILALATGAGKTITALYAATRLFIANKRLFLVVAVPYTDLADQWLDEAAMFNMQAIGCYDSAASWRDELGKAIQLFNAGVLPFVCAVVVNKTLQGEFFQEALKNIDGNNLMFVGDECHRHRSTKSIESLPPQARYRLGLSATPEQHFANPDAEDPLYKYYGAICARYTLSQALNDKVLTPYDYHLVLVELTGDEMEQYIDLSDQIAKRAAVAGLGDEGSSSDSLLEMLLFKRARLIGAAQNKLPSLSKLLAQKEPTPLTLFYCGDGSVEMPEDGTFIRQVEAVSMLLGESGWRSSRFTSAESKNRRRELLEDFKIANIDALVAIRCLDEGINIPSCHTAYLMASSRNPRQFIQRRGRILRRAPGKLKAVIYDFIVTLPNSAVETFAHERKLFGAELNRVAEFAGLCLNYADAYKQVESLLQRYNLIHEFREKNVGDNANDSPPVDG
jgi:superfamily II DNA or RNA helicase